MTFRCSALPSIHSEKSFSEDVMRFSSSQLLFLREENRKHREVPCWEEAMMLAAAAAVVLMTQIHQWQRELPRRRNCSKNSTSWPNGYCFVLEGANTKQMRHSHAITSSARLSVALDEQKRHQPHFTASPQPVAMATSGVRWWCECSHS